VLALSEPEITFGDVAVDDRGELGFVNGFHFGGVKRFYWIRNHSRGYVRAWHAHKREEKYFLPVQGAMLIGAVEIDDWEKPSKDAKVWRFTLAAHRPTILHVSAGYANGFMNLTKNARLMVFSTATLEESKQDDYRYDSRHWDIWNVAER
jgi:dTDP-4-dehydrorhamnose 3,5-epimerase